MDLTERFEFRYIRPEEADQACDIEFECFPPNEYCSREMITGRVVRVPQSFYVAADRESGKLAGFLTSMATDAEAFQDEFFSNADLFEPGGRNAMILGLEVRPAYQHQGIGKALMTNFLAMAKSEGRRRVILTCHEDTIPMYERMGFRNLGISGSVWGGETWIEMDKVL